jgi:hypothetical protein
LLFYDEQKGHAVIGEAAVSLAVNDQQISVDALMNKLTLMAEVESSDARLQLIYDARKWLSSFLQPANRNRAELNWLTLTGQPKEGNRIFGTDLWLQQSAVKE